MVVGLKEEEGGAQNSHNTYAKLALHSNNTYSYITLTHHSLTHRSHTTNTRYSNNTNSYITLTQQ